MRTITAKLTRIYLVVTVSVLFSAGLISQLYLYLHARVVAHENLSTQAAALAGHLESAVTLGDARFAQQILNALQHYPDVLGAAVIFPDGKPLATYAAKGGKDGADDLQKYLAQGEFMTSEKHGVTQMIALGGQIPARLVIVASLERTNREALLLLAAHIVISALILFATFEIFWRLTRRVTRPIENLTEVMRRIELERNHSQRAPIASDDEIGEMAKGFNSMLSSLEEKSIALNSELSERIRIEAQSQATKNRLQATIDAIPDLMFEVGMDGRIYHYHAHRNELLAAPPEAFLGRRFSEIIPPDAAKVCWSAIREAKERGWSEGKQYSLNLPKGPSWFEISVAPMREADERNQHFIVISREITERKQAEQQMRVAAAAFESQEGMVVTDSNNQVLRINKAFTEITGYKAEDAIGQDMNFLKSDRHDDGFYAAMWATIKRAGTWQGEIWNRTKSGEVHPHWVTISAVTNSDNIVTHYVGTYTDITERKQIEDQVRHQAYHDPLTKLANRRLFSDRLSHTMAVNKRSACYGALMFLDLDNFKPLNDQHGHEVGDSLLIEVANRLKRCVREMDTVARFGGDEFVVMLSELSVDKAESTSQAGIVAEKIRKALAEPYLLTVRHAGAADTIVEHRCTASIGVALFVNHAASPTPDEILSWADTAMYQAKDAGRNSIRFSGSG